jgi:NAD(P)-dependent dehydrogenase (short-subunit alcohol dehydrogenase family)
MNQKRVACITGGARGIGFGIAQDLAREGFDIVIADVRDEAGAAESIQTLAGLGAKVLYCQTDISIAAARTAMVERIRTTFGRLHVLVNNAGVAPAVRADILDATEESFERLMRINLQGPYFLTQTVARWLIEQKKADPAFKGCIVNISSCSATVASVGRGEYCISKAGVSMATQLWAARLGEFDIPVYEVRPGIIKTDMTATVTAKYDKLIAEGLLVQSRWGLPEDVARAVAMFARGDLPYSTGQVVHVDGGLNVHRL